VQHASSTGRKGVISCDEEPWFYLCLPSPFFLLPAELDVATSCPAAALHHPEPSQHSHGLACDAEKAVAWRRYPPPHLRFLTHRLPSQMHPNHDKAPLPPGKGGELQVMMQNPHTSPVHSPLPLPVICFVCTIFFSIHPCIHPCIHPSIHSSIHPSVHLSIHPYIYTHPPAYLYIYQSSYLPIHQSVCVLIYVLVNLSIYLPSPVSLSLPCTNSPSPCSSPDGPLVLSSSKESTESIFFPMTKLFLRDKDEKLRRFTHLHSLPHLSPSLIPGPFHSSTW
jgi:hypothetical protein